MVPAAAAVAGLPLSAPTNHIDFSAALYLLLGIRDAEDGDFEKAVARYESALAVDPAYAAVCNYMGAARASRGNPDEATRWYSRAIEINPRYSEARNNLGYALSQSGRNVKAIEQYEAAPRLRPGPALTHNNLGLELVRLGRAATYDPEHYEACNNLAWILATHPDAAIRDGNRAITLAEHVQRRGEARVPTALDTLAAPYAEVGRY